MNLLSIILLALIGFWIAAAVIYLIRHRGTACCKGGCNHACGHCKHSACRKRNH